MVKFLIAIALLPMVLCISACENAELKNCKKEASKLWDASQDDPKKNKAYWNAIERCKEKYD